MCHMVWLWQHEHDEAIKKLKVALTNAPVLKFFDPKKQLDIQADASKDGLGACLLQDGYPIAYTSRELTVSERNYAQIEKELLAIVFAVRKFHQYVYGVRAQAAGEYPQEAPWHSSVQTAEDVTPAAKVRPKCLLQAR